MEQKRYTLAVYIGRFQPFHNGHLHVVDQSRQIADKTLILLGSSNTAPSYKNPFSVADRTRMIRDTLGRANGFAPHPYEIRPIVDCTYDENAWIAQIQRIVAEYETNDTKVVLVGYQRDHSSYYLEYFPMWHTYFTEEHTHYNEPINGTQIRDEFFDSPAKFFRSHYMDIIPAASIEFMQEFAATEHFRDLREDWSFVQKYREDWKFAPYPPVFVTVDSIVVQSGHVLLIQRKNSPGKSLWAIPGGFLDEHEDIATAQIRELMEETSIKVPEKVLQGSKTYERVFDSPVRSGRGRTITHAALFELKNDKKLPRVRASDDAIDAEWISFSDFESYAPQMFEDHWHIVKHMLRNSRGAE